MAVKAINGNLIVSIGDQRTTLANGMSVQEQRGKKDVVKATVRISGSKEIPTGSSVWFPFYAALPIVFGGNQLHVVNEQDVMLVE